MIELLRAAAALDAAAPAVITNERTVSYGELAADAEAVAAGLDRRGVSRFAVVDIDAARVTALLAGASAVGAEACVYPPDAPAVIRGLAGRFDHEFVVSDRSDLDERATVTSMLSLMADSGEPFDPPEQRPLLILTTGTTGAPRGVRHDWHRIMHAARRIYRAPEQRWLLAYGLHQFAGLQMLVHVFTAAATLVAPAPRQPREGLAAMRRHGVDHASATPTYWRFLLAEMRADGGPVPALRQITLGGEAVPEPLLRQLAAAFPQAKISQVYAASEFGSTGSVRDARGGLPLDILDRPDDADVTMKIVDGQLWVRSRIGMLGYYGEPLADPDGWRATGDLVDLVDDRIAFRGRASEIINVGGVKVHPLPIEERIVGVPGVEVARVFGRPNAVTGAIVAVEIVATDASDPAALKSAVRAACADLPRAAQPRSIRFVESVAMAGDKIVRRSTT